MNGEEVLKEPKRSSKRGDDGNPKYFALACSKTRKRQSVGKDLFKSQLSTKTGCKAIMRFKMRDDGKFEVTTVQLDHYHLLSPGKVRHFRCNRILDEHVKRRLELNDQVGISMSKNYQSLVVEAGGYENVTFNQKDCRNYIEKARQTRLGVGDAEVVCKYFTNMQENDPNFFYAMDIDDDCHIRNLFWADGRSRAVYEAFGDVITFDTTYLTNKYHMPFAPFIGVNHHGQSVLFGCGLLTTEETESFVWWCLWHIMNKIPEKLRGYSAYKEIKTCLKAIVYDSLIEEEFETGWSLMIESYDLDDNEWLKRLYLDRQKWILAYVKSTFWAGMSTTQRSESMNAYFDDYVNSKTTLKNFVEQYEKALEAKVEKENLADYQSFNSWYECLSNYEIEKQFQEVYTNEKFKEFQDELKQKFYCYPSFVKHEDSVYVYEVAEDVMVGDDRKDIIFTINFNEAEFEVSCKCRLFEFRGILYRHALSVLIIRKVKVIHAKYI
ncbi:hypothetical protein REPUB_Repub16aG0064600 [Reevesia pubescens]